MQLITLTISVLALILSTYLFRKAAGTLKISEMNIISFAYYNLMVFTCIGSLIILLGFRDHYMVEKIESVDVVYKTHLFLAYAMIMLPLAIIIFSQLFIRGSVKEKYDFFLKERIDFKKNESVAWILCLFATLLGIVFTFYMFYNMGGVPLLYLLRTRSVSTMLRVSITRQYSGNIYFRNIIVLMLTPLLSYFTYIYMRISTKNKTKWIILFVIDAVLAVLIKTYNLEKSPIIYWAFYFYIIEIMINKKNALKLLKGIGVISIFLISEMYLFAGYEGRFLSLSSGPLSRLIMTQASTLFLHIQVFPQLHAFLKGASLPTAVAWVFGSSQSWVRSGSVVMQVYNVKGVLAGEAGVMNAMFIGEAYANWGTIGVLISPFIVAFPLVIAYGILLRQPKTPLTIVLYIALFITYTTSLQGGFVDFIYNTNFIILILCAVFLQTVFLGGRITIRK